MTDREMLQFILDGAENVDLNHRDFRIQVAQMAQAEMDKLKDTDTIADLNWIINRVAVSPAAIESAREERRRMNLADTRRNSQEGS